MLQKIRSPKLSIVWSLLESRYDRNKTKKAKVAYFRIDLKLI